MRRVRNVRGTTAVAVLTLAATALGPAASASAQASAKKVTIKVVGISRTGATVAVTSFVVPPHGNEIPGTGPAFHLKPGPYFIGANVPTPAAGSDAANQTIVVRRVDVRRSGTIRLDARGGKLVSVWLDGKDLGEPASAVGCIDDGFGVVDATQGQSGPLYVKPVRTAGVSFVWALTASAPKGATYDLLGQSSNGLPTQPTYRLRSSGLVKTTIQVRTGTVPSTRGFLDTQGAISSCGLPGLQQSVTPPTSLTVFRSPAYWTTGLNTYQGLQQCSLNRLNTKETAGHRYTVALGEAARGPSTAVPVIVGKQLSFDPQWQFRDPAFQDYDYCYQANVALRSGGHVVAKMHYVQLKARNFTAKVHPGRWYVLTTDARQAVQGAKLTGLLSPRTVLAWRFKFAKGVNGAVPVADTSLVPQGLDLNNQAAPGSMTSVRAFFTQGRYISVARPAVPVRSFTVWASFNDGKTWHGVAVVKHKGFWTFAVHNPTSGFVTLRTITVNTRGDSSTQTIYRAYGIG